MPDGDSLNWKVRGKGSRTVLSLIRSGADLVLTSQQAGRMLVAQARQGGWKPPLRHLATVLERKFAAQESERRCEPYLRTVERIVRNHWGDPIDWIIPAVRKAVYRLEAFGTSTDSAEVKKVLMSEACQALVDHRVLQPIRQELMKEFHRDKCEQLAHESELLHVVGLAGEDLVKTFLESEEAQDLRAPRRTVRKRVTDSQRLSEPLKVLEGDRS